MSRAIIATAGGYLLRLDRADRALAFVEHVFREHYGVGAFPDAPDEMVACERSGEIVAAVGFRHCMPLHPTLPIERAFGVSLEVLDAERSTAIEACRMASLGVPFTLDWLISTAFLYQLGRGTRTIMGVLQRDFVPVLERKAGMMASVTSARLRVDALPPVCLTLAQKYPHVLVAFDLVACEQTIRRRAAEVARLLEAPAREAT